MNRYCLTLILAFFSFIANAQNFTGQWKGSFIDKSTTFMGFGGDHCDYVLELESKGTSVSGYSYTYFSDGEKRYFTICKLEGNIDPRSHSIVVRELERTKTNVPTNIRNCFQIHKLTYFKKDDEITLEGTWSPAPDQEGDCGYGTTILSKRIMKPNPLLTKRTVAKKPLGVNPKPPIVKTNPPVRVKPPVKTSPVVKNTAKVPLVKQTAVIKKPVTTTPKKTVQVQQPVVKNIVKAPLIKQEAIVNKPLEPEERAINTIQNKTPLVPVSAPGFEKRNSTLIKTIEIENDVVKVDLYDNGDIDGDSVSLFYNGKLILSHQRLSDHAISVNITVDPSHGVNELVMYADNLGTIPPNTALMVVTDGEKRYEARITSDLQKSGSIMFLRKPKPGQ